jgi:hypothetical protein
VKVIEGAKEHRCAIRAGPLTAFYRQPPRIARYGELLACEGKGSAKHNRIARVVAVAFHCVQEVAARNVTRIVDAKSRQR